ncbi:MAG TPA: tRNA (guanosine(46)-N7)-methyltransferase TrmB [Patescibacteria group bacterium]|nr:tRNA (guanosine(46)-N7)-methyltransferase TrmB [Patescibacteria group bacterium]
MSESTGSTLPRREIKSFVKRIGRITAGQKLALDTQWPRFGLDYGGVQRDLAAVFGNAHAVVLEIGFGNGEALFAAAKADPARNYLGIEVHEPGVGRLLRDADAAGLGNLRVSKHDAVEVLRQEIAPGALAEVRLYFPDPWHKKRHHKRRIVQPDFVEMLASRLAPGGLFHLATDWEPYAAHMFDVLDASASFRNELGPRQSAPRPDWRIETHFQKRGERLGHGVWDLLYRKR